MHTRWIAATLGVSLLLGLTGCSATGAVTTGARMGLNLARKDSYLKIWLDGQAAVQNTLKKAATGYSRFDIKEPVATAPKLKFEIQDPDRFGRITSVMVSIYRKFEAEYSHQADFTVVAASATDPQAQMKPNIEYDLGAPGPGFKVMDLTGKDAPGVKLLPGMEYMLTLTVKADKSETAQIYFKTK